MKTKLIALLVVHAIALPSSAVSPGEEALSAGTDSDMLANATRRASVGAGSKSFLSLQTYLSLSFGVPVSYEWPYVDGTGTALAPPDVSPWLQSTDSLRSALDNLSVVTKQALIWTQIRGNICVLPPEEAEGIENTLDTLVSLKLQNVSTWEALKQLVTKINHGTLLDRRTRMDPIFGKLAAAPPPGFRDGNEVTLTLKNVTARDALFAIFHESAFQMAYSYWTWHRPDLNPNSRRLARISIYFFENGTYYQSPRRMTWEEELEFTMEKQAMDQDE